MIEKGTPLETGDGNRLVGSEIADVMERFSLALFQIRVWIDLAVSRYRLYDATGLWLDSRRELPPATYEEARSVARAYLDESLAPDYFERMRAGFPLTPKLYLKVPNAATRDFAALPEREQVETMAEFHRHSLRKREQIYSLKGGRYVAAENETGEYTLMLASDY